jgi:hypothetical protein
METLPVELIDQIGSYLSWWDRHRFRQTCRDYAQLFPPPEFMDLPVISRHHVGRILRVLETSPGVIDGSPILTPMKHCCLMAVCRELGLTLTILGKPHLFLNEYRKLAQPYGITDVAMGESFDDITWNQRIQSGTLVLYPVTSSRHMPLSYASRLASTIQSKSRSRIIFDTPYTSLSLEVLQTIALVLGIISWPQPPDQLALSILAWCAQRYPELKDLEATIQALPKTDSESFSSKLLLGFLYLSYLQPNYCVGLPVINPDFSEK